MKKLLADIFIKLASLWGCFTGSIMLFVLLNGEYEASKWTVTFLLVCSVFLVIGVTTVRDNGKNRFHL